MRGLPLNVGAGLFPVEGDNVLPGFRVVPAQLSVLPPDEEIERGAVTLQDPFLFRPGLLRSVMSEAFFAAPLRLEEGVSSKRSGW